MKSNSGGQYVVCVRNGGCEASLERRKIYRATPDKRAAAMGLVRVKDESGQSYLYPGRYFVAVKLPQPVLRAITLAA